MTSTPDALAETARELALAALHEITPPTTVGPAAGYSVEESGAVSLRFQNRLPGYPGWFWTVTVAQVDDSEPTVLEVELMPGDGALLAPDWVPWAERLAEYRAHQAELAAQTADAPVDDSHEDDDSEDDDSDDEHPEDDSDEDDSDEDVSPRLHAGDVDGVDIDELDDSLDADASEQSDDESEDDASEDDDESEEDESDDDDEDPDESE
ncbi:DUF3027 domain-containing protein [Microbacterium sp. NPDC077391]|uniref:DUF3027 domain-containing protein n=1 Tax=unclassified Microbacterium TaxID=2609290 RepID=UPI0028AF4CBF|nr:DUF3027 domain-containing protein [Microbacterium sp.]